MHEDEKLLLPLREVTRLLGLRSDTVLYALMKKSDAEGRPLLPAVKLGKLTMFPMAGVRAFIASLPPALPDEAVTARMNRVRRGERGA